MDLELNYQEHYEAEAYLYWIHTKEHVDMFTEGYIGVSTAPYKRFQAHRSTLRNPIRAKDEYKEDFITTFNRVGLIMSVIDCGEIKDVLYKEYQLRPNENVGWNIAVGGRVNQVCAKYKHGGSSDQTMFQRFIKMLGVCEDKNLYVDFNFHNDSGFKLFCLHINDESTNGVANKEVALIDESKGLIVGNFVLRDKSEHADHDRWVFYNNKWWSKREACAHNGVDYKTAEKRLSRYNMTREQAVGFEPFLQSSYKIIILDGVECRYNTKISKFSEEDLVKMYEYYKSGSRDFKTMCKSCGVESSNMIRYFKRYNLNSKVDRRSKSFRGSEND